MNILRKFIDVLIFVIFKFQLNVQTLRKSIFCLFIMDQYLLIN